MTRGLPKAGPVRQFYHSAGCGRRDGGCACAWGYRRPGLQPDGSITWAKPSFPTKAQAAADRAAFEAQRLIGVPSLAVDRTTTVADYLDHWTSMLEARGRAETYVYSVRSNTGRHIRPRLGGRLVTEVTTDDVIRCHAQLDAAGVGLEARRKAIDNLEAMFNYWLKKPPDGQGKALPYGNPVPPHLVPRPERKEFDPLSWDDVRAIADAMPQRGERIMVTIGYLYGFRVGELLALREDDLEFTGGRDPALTLAEALAERAGWDEDRYRARPVRINSVRQRYPSGQLRRTKTGKVRRHRLDQQVAGELAASLALDPPAGGQPGQRWLFTNRSHYAGRWTDAVKLHDVAVAAGVADHTVTRALAQAYGTPGWQRGGYSGNGLADATLQRILDAAGQVGWPRVDPYSYQTFAAHFKQAAAAVGIALPDRQATHALRHGCVSRLAAEGKMPVEIAEFIRDRVETVMSVYMRVRSERKAEIEHNLHPDGRRGLRVVRDDETA